MNKSYKSRIKNFFYDSSTNGKVSMIYKKKRKKKKKREEEDRRVI